MLDAALTAAYSVLQNVYRDENIVTPTTIAADDGIPFLTGNADRIAMWKYNLVPTNTFVYNIWSFAYTGVQRSNVVINRIPGVAMDEALKKRYVAEVNLAGAPLLSPGPVFLGDVPLGNRRNCLAGRRAGSPVANR